MTSEKKCCVPFCDSQQQTLHKFPNPDKDPDRFRTWMYNIGGDILSLQNAKVFKRRRVCHLHFESKFDTRSKLLSPNAVPTLNLSGSKAKDARRSPRDGNILKTTTTQTGTRWKYSNFTLDTTLESRRTSTNIIPPQPGYDEPLSPSSLLRQSSPVGRLSTPAPRQSSLELKLSLASLQSGQSDSSQSLLDTLHLPSLRQLQQPSTTKKRINSSNRVDNADRTLDYHKNKKKKELDDSDHLFRSYAKSFKKLSVRNQAKIKVALAKVFAEAEFDEFQNNNSTNELTTGT